MTEPCRAAVSAPVGFHAPGSRAYVAMLDGTLTAWNVAITTPAAPGAEGASGMALTMAWRRQMGAPIFAAPAVLAETGQVIVATAAGSVTSFLASGDSSHSLLTFNSTSKVFPFYSSICCLKVR